MRVWIFQTGGPFPIAGSTGRPMRSMNLARALVDAGHEVVVWGGDWNHYDKRHFYGRHTKVAVEPGYELRLVHSRGYRENISAARLVDHAEYALELRRLLARETELPDVAVVSFPPIESAYVVSRWLAAHGVPVLLDAVDRWPEIYLRAVPAAVRPLARGVLQPYFAMSHSTMRNVTGICSMTPEFLDWALRQAGRERGPADGVFPLTVPLLELTPAQAAEAEEWWTRAGVVLDGRPRASFVGTHNSAFDFRPIRRAAEALDMEFVIAGTGSMHEDVRSLLGGIPNVVIPGWVTHAQAEVLARHSQFALGPYVPTPDFRDNMPNKVFDALAHGQPFVSSLTGVVEREVYARNAGVGYTLEPGPNDLVAVLGALLRDPARTAAMSAAARDLYATTLSGEKVYGEMVEHLQALASRSG